MVKTTYEKGAVLVTGSDAKHIEIYRFKEKVEVERKPGGWYVDGKLVDLRQFCVRVPKADAEKILRRLKANANVQVKQTKV